MIKTKYIAVGAVSIDGKIAVDQRQDSNWTSKEDKLFLRKILDASDAVIIGNTTYEIAKKHLAKRTCIVFTRSVAVYKKENERLLYCNPENFDVKKYVAGQKYKQMIVLGGAQIYNYCLAHGMIDELFLTIEPVVFGKGISVFGGSSVGDCKMQLMSVKKLNSEGSLLLHYKQQSISS